MTATALTIKTNNQPRPLMAAWELSESDQRKLRKQFDYLDDAEFDGLVFVSYKNYWYSLCDFMGTPSACDEFNGWHGYHADSFFSGVLIKLLDDDYVIMGRYCS